MIRSVPFRSVPFFSGSVRSVGSVGSLFYAFRFGWVCTNLLADFVGSFFYSVLLSRFPDDPNGPIVQVSGHLLPIL